MFTKKINNEDYQAQIDDLPVWAWLWFPPLMLILIYSFRAWDSTLYSSIFETEHGVVELATPVLAFLGVAFGIATFRYLQQLNSRLIRSWIVCTTLGCLYIGGEEISWGQWLFLWDTPEAFMDINDQQETNIHNISSWFDQKPRLLLELWILIGGIILPLWNRYKNISVSAEDWRYWFWPGQIMLPTAVLVIFSKLPERYLDIFELDEIPLRIRYSEAQEYYFALFLMLYLASIWLRLRNRRDSSLPPSPDLSRS